MSLFSWLILCGLCGLLGVMFGLSWGLDWGRKHERSLHVRRPR